IKKSAILIGLVLVVGIGAYMLAGSNLFKGSVYIDEMNKLAGKVNSYNYAGSYFDQHKLFTNDTIEVGEVSSWEVRGGTEGTAGAIFASKKVGENSIGSWRVLKAGFAGTAGTDAIAITSVNDAEQNLRSDGEPSEISERCIYVDTDLNHSFSPEEKEICFAAGGQLPNGDAPYLIQGLTPATPYDVAVVITDLDGRKDWEVKNFRTQPATPVVVVDDPVDDPTEASATVACEMVDYTYSEDLSTVSVEWMVKLDASQFDPALNDNQNNWTFDWDFSADNFATIEGTGIASIYEYSNLPNPFTGPMEVVANIKTTSNNGDNPAATAEGVCRGFVNPPEVEEPDVAVINSITCREVENSRVTNLDTVTATFEGFYDTVPEITATDDNGNNLWEVSWDAVDADNTTVDNATSAQPTDNYVVTLDRPQVDAEAATYDIHVSAQHDDGTSEVSPACSINVRAQDPETPPEPEEEEELEESLTMDIRLSPTDTGAGFYDYEGFNELQELRVYGVFKAGPSYNGQVVDNATYIWSATYTDENGTKTNLEDPYIISNTVVPGTDEQLGPDRILLAFPTPPDSKVWSGTVSVQASATINEQPAEAERTINIKIAKDGVTQDFSAFGGSEWIDYEGLLGEYNYSGSYSFNKEDYYIPYEGFGTDSVFSALDEAIDEEDPGVYDVVYADAGSSVFFEPNCNASGLDEAVRIVPAAQLPDGEKGVVKAFLKANLFNSETNVAIFDIEDSDSCAPPEPEQATVEIACGDLTLNAHGEATIAQVTNSSGFSGGNFDYEWTYENQEGQNPDVHTGTSEGTPLNDLNLTAEKPNKSGEFAVNFKVKPSGSGDEEWVSAEPITCKNPQITCNVNLSPSGGYQENLSITGLNEQAQYDVWTPENLAIYAPVANGGYSRQLEPETQEGSYTLNLVSSGDGLALYDSATCTVPAPAELGLSCNIVKSGDGSLIEIITVDTDDSPHSYTWAYAEGAPGNVAGEINLSEVPVNGQKSRALSNPTEGSEYTVSLSAQTTTAGTLSAEAVCVVPNVAITCEVDPNPIAEGENAGKYAATITSTVSGFDESSSSHQWGQTSPVQSQSDLTPGLPGHRTLIIDPAQGHKTAEYLQISDSVHGRWEANTECQIPPKITCEQDENGNAVVSTFGIESNHYYNGYEWVFGDEAELPADPESYYADQSNYDAVDFGSTSTPEHPTHEHAYEDTKSHTVNLYMHGQNAQAESTYTKLSAACAGNDAPVIDAVDDPELEADVYETLQGNSIIIPIFDNDTFNGHDLKSQAVIESNLLNVPAAENNPNPNKKYVLAEVLPNPENDFKGDGVLTMEDYQNEDGTDGFATGDFFFLPKPDFVGYIDFHYKITDVESGANDIAKIRINVKPAEPTGSLACSVEANKAVLTANFSRNESFSENMFVVVWYQNNEIFDVDLVSAAEMDEFVDKKVEYEHNSADNFTVSMLVIPIDDQMVNKVPVDNDRDGEADLDENGDPMYTLEVAVPAEELPRFLNYKYVADCTVPEDLPVPPVDRPVPPANVGQNYCSIVNTNSNISDSDINQSEQSIDCSVNISIDNSVTNYYYYPENVKETVIIEKTPDAVPDKTVIDNKIPKDPVTPEDPEVREEI
ncbi:hypothetical protein HY605_01140, partial [Candidatus Peregrinibacteria bacterium]|nr:hypothetical protein [Candidatus Peregrinibacteria bacterium]